MKISGFSFIRNGEQLGYPFIQSIKSILPICDEFIIAVGDCHDKTREMLATIESDKIQIINTVWNPHLPNNFMLAEQKMIAQYACSGDWAFYLEGDEIIHEDDLTTIKRQMETHLKNDLVEVLVFDYFHFYGSINYYVNSPSWYRRAPRAIKRRFCSFVPDSLSWFIFDKKHKRHRWPNAALAHVPVYHYGWVRSLAELQEKKRQMAQYNWFDIKQKFDYTDIDPKTLKPFLGTHPQGIASLYDTETTFTPNPNYQLTRKDRKNRVRLTIEKMFSLDLSKKNWRVVEK